MVPPLSSTSLLFTKISRAHTRVLGLLSMLLSGERVEAALASASALKVIVGSSCGKSALKQLVPTSTRLELENFRPTSSAKRRSIAEVNAQLDGVYKLSDEKLWELASTDVRVLTHN